MAKTTSWAMPNIFNVAQNTVEVLEDEKSVINRSKLLILTEPTEIYNEPNQGVGLKRYMFQYNTDNTKALIKDKIVEQLRLHEPQCNPDGTQMTDGLLFTGSTQPSSEQKYNKLELTVSIETSFGSSETITFN